MVSESDCRLEFEKTKARFLMCSDYFFVAFNLHRGKFESVSERRTQRSVLVAAYRPVHTSAGTPSQIHNLLGAVIQRFTNTVLGHVRAATAGNVCAVCNFPRVVHVHRVFDFAILIDHRRFTSPSPRFFDMLERGEKNDPWSWLVITLFSQIWGYPVYLGSNADDKAGGLIHSVQIKYAEIK